MANEQLREENIRTVLEQALIVFSEKGIERTTIKDIAKKAEISDRSVYRYFPTKDELIIETVKHALKKSQVQIAEIFMNENFQRLSGSEQTIELARQMLLYARNNKKSQLSIAELEPYCYRYHIPDAFSLYDNRNNKIVQWFKISIEKGIRDGTIKPDLGDDPDYFILLAVSFRAFLNRIVIIDMNAEMRSHYNPDRLVEGYLMTLRHSIETSGQERNEVLS